MSATERIDRREKTLIIFCAVIYFFNYLCRINFAASLASMIEGLDTTKTAISIALTGNAITYGAGQVVCGLLGDKFSPRVFITAGLLGSAVCNFCVGMVSSVPLVWVFWSINGIAQAMIWPSLMRVMTENLSRRAYMIAAPAVSYACSFSTFAVYMCMVPFCVSFFTWRMSFFVPAVLTTAVAVAWFLSFPRLKAAERVAVEEKKVEVSALPKRSGGFAKAFWRAGLPVIFLCVMLQGILRDGVSEWMPSFIIETYNLGEASAVMSAAILPAFSIFCVFVTVRLYRRLPNEQLSSLVFWIVAAVSAVLLYFFHENHAVVAVITMAFLNGAMHGINHLLTARISPYFVKYHCVSTVTGLINAFTYVGSAVAAPLSAYLSEISWGAVILLWLGVAALGCLATALHSKSYTRFISEHK